MDKNYLKLICESDFFDLKIVEEQANQHEKKILKIRGPYIATEVINANGRKYSKSVMEKAVAEYGKNYIEKNRAVGELNHPTSTEVDYNNACHKILSLTQEGNIWIGESQVLIGTPKGDLVAGLLKNDVQIGISTRGVGNVTTEKVVDKYKLVAADVVYEPSAPGAMLAGILESKNFMIDEHGEIIEVVFDALKKDLENLPLKAEMKKATMINAIESFLRNIP